MKRARRLKTLNFSLGCLMRSWNRAISVSVCLALVTSGLAFSSLHTVTARKGKRQQPVTPQETNGKARRVDPPPPRSGPPAGNLPNLDEILGAQPNPVEAPAAIPSTLRRHRRERSASSTGASSSVIASLNAQPGQGLTSGSTSSLVRSHHARSARVAASMVAPQGGSNFPMARISPTNRTGTGGEDLLSNNFNVNLPVVGLRGRGLDLGLTLSYNSLVWTRSGNYIDFDVDDGSIAPGFRLGFATVEGPYYNDQAGQNFYLLVTPSGARVELRYTGSGNIYESKDSAHVQLINNGTSLLVRPTDGTQMNFILVSGTWRCNQVKDRNGNFITISYNAAADIATITDTLGRVLSFNYDGYGNVTSITQAGKAQPWATFGWGTASIGNNFPSLTNLGPVSTSIAVLTQVGFADGSRYNFEYNNSYGMVSKIRHHESDTSLRSYTTYVAPASATDCPRVTERRVWADDWNGIAGVPSEVVTYFAHDGDGACRLTAPDGTIYKEYYGSSWQSGLTTQSEVWSAGVKQKWTTIAWTQDNTGVSYLTNPRVTETNTYDPSGNRRRTAINYGSYASYGLPYEVLEYAANGTTPLRSTYIDYNLSADYVSRRIIGLPSAVHGVDHQLGVYVSKTTYDYDWNGEYLTTLPAAAPNHAANNSDPTGRGNLVRTLRWDVTDINNGAKVLQQTMGYNSSGSPVFQRDGLNHQTSASYADAFSDGINRNTFAYPTTATDPDGFQSSVQYNFDFGAVTRTQSPTPAGQSQGAIQIMLYDSAGRIERVTTQNTGAYTRYIHGPYYVQSFSSVNSVTDDAYSCQIFDGAGRVIAASANHPGSTGGYIGRLTEYDQMGRAKRQSNPTEITGGWGPVGDDAAGWIYSQQSYDWKGRPLVSTNQDGTQKYAIYGGCGCAGGEVVTLTDEVGRQQKVYSDVVGRQWKTEVLNLNGTVYSTTTNTFNARDQVTLMQQWAGAENGGGAYQDTTMSYDGYGRLKTKHVPEQNVGTATVYAYNTDDTIQSVTDARGASATYSYNSRHLVTAINYSAPGGITPASNVTFGYDASGNRTSMTDGLGSMSYAYNQLSRMTSETRTFTGLGNYTIGYDYNLAGELKSITDPANSRVDYMFDSSGRLSTITGNNYGVSQFLTATAYRAWGAVKQASYGNGRTLSMTYNQRQRVSHLEMPGVMSFDYQFYDDASLKYSHDVLDQRFDRSYEYDHAGRITKGRSGAAARGEPDNADRPYYQTYTRDAFNHLTNRVTKHWSKSPPYISVDSYTNNRRNGWSYDAEGNLTDNVARQFGYDAAGQISFVSGSSLDQYFDGDGQRAKTVEPNLTTYYVRSSVLDGRVVAELDGSGSRLRGFVYQGTKLLAEQGQNGSVVFVFADASGRAIRYTDSQYGYAFILNELDPVGAESERENPYPLDPEYTGRGEGGALFPGFGNITQPSTGCTLDGVYALCEWVNRGLQNGSTQIQLMTTTNKPQKFPVRDFGLGLFGIWIEDEGRKLEQRQTEVGDEFDESDIIATNTDSDGLGHWVLAAVSFTPQNPGVEFLRDNSGNTSYGPGKEKMIFDAILALYTDDCINAFKAAGLKDPFSLITGAGGGVVIGPSSLATNPSNTGYMGVPEQARQEILSEFGNTSTRAFTVMGKYTRDGRPRMFLNASAFANGLGSLVSDMAHEFVHAAEVKGVKPSWYTPWQDDLSFDSKYQDIIDTCRKAAQSFIDTRR